MRIRPDETSGVLHPENLTRYAARWIDPDPAVRDVVDTYWHVRWHLDEGEVGRPDDRRPARRHTDRRGR